MAKTTRQDIERARPLWSEEFKRLNPGLEGPLEGQNSALGAPCSLPEPKKTPTPLKSPLAAIFEEMWDGPELIPEHRFDAQRKWRFDYAIPEHRIAIELEGGIHSRKGHASPEQFIKDCSKYNHATAAGWLVFRLASGMMKPEHVGLVARGIERIILEREADF
jgi:very-short-patch-repair endonuclease